MKKLIRKLIRKLIEFSFPDNINPLDNINDLVFFKNLRSNFVTICNGCVISNDSSIGSYTFIGYNTLITKSSIGKYCSIASNVSIGHGDHIIDNISTSSLFYEDAYATLTYKDCIIEDDVWIGVDSIIRRGVKIGFGAIIGANSFVNDDVPEFAIVAGSPAKIIKYRFNENERKIIKESKWWESDFEHAQEIIKKLNEDFKSF